MRTFIYALAHPTTGRVRYIGKSIKPRSRFNQHLCEARRGKSNPAKRAWILGLLQSGRLPSFTILRSCRGSGRRIETRLISEYRAHGRRLLNLSDGGEGCPGYKLTPEQRDRIRASAKRVLTDEQVRLAIRLYNRGFRLSEIESRVGTRNLYYWFYALGTKLRGPRRHLNNELECKAVRMYRAGIHTKKIQARLGLGAGTLYTALANQGIRPKRMGGIVIPSGRVRRIRVRSGLRKKDAAERAGMLWEQWNNIEKRRGKPTSAAVIARLAKALGCSIRTLTGQSP